MTHHANQEEIDDISSKLKFVAKIQPTQRVNVKNCLSLQDKYSWSGRFWRTYQGNEGRYVTYEFVKELIDRAYKFLSSLRHSVSEYDYEVYCKILKELVLIEPGMRNLTATYEKDDEYVTTIETLIDGLKIKIRELCDYKNIDLKNLINDDQKKTSTQLNKEDESKSYNSDKSETDGNYEDEYSNSGEDSDNEDLNNEDIISEDNQRDQCIDTSVKLSYKDVLKSDLPDTPSYPDTKEQKINEPPKNKTLSGLKSVREEDPELLELLNRTDISRVPQRKNRSGKKKNKSIADANPFRFLNDNYQYDMENGLMPR
jgi:hypothetical protein